MEFGRVDANEIVFHGRVGARIAPRPPLRFRRALDDLLPKSTSARDFFNAMLKRYPNRRLGATTLWAGTSALCALRDRHGDEVFHASIAGWFK